MIIGLVAEEGETIVYQHLYLSDRNQIIPAAPKLMQISFHSPPEMLDREACSR